MIGSLVTFKNYMLRSLLDMQIAITSALGKKRARIGSGLSNDPPRLRLRGDGLICGGRHCVREIWHSRVQAPIYEDTYDNGETYEKRKPCRGVIPNGLRIAAFCPLSSVQFLGCHCGISSCKPYGLAGSGGGAGLPAVAASFR